MLTEQILRQKFGFNDPNVIRHILNDPGERARYERELAQANNSSASGFTAPSFGSNLNHLLQQQQQEQENFLNRYRAFVSGMEALPAMNERISKELGLPALRQTAFDLTQTLEKVPQTQKDAARGFDVNQNQLDRIIASQQAKLAPLAQRAVAQKQFAEEQLADRLKMELNERQRQLTPFELEASMLSDRMAREITGYNNQMQNELTLLLQKLNSQKELTMAEMERVNRLALMEKQFENQKQLISARRTGGGATAVSPLARYYSPQPSGQKRLDDLVNFARRHNLLK